MIKITESVAGQTKSTLFKEDTLLIGDSQGGAHIPYSGRGLKNEHVKIYKQGDEVWIQNLANDPFVTLNLQPFFKKRAQVGDVLKIRDIDIKIEEISDIKESPYPAPPLASEKEPVKKSFSPFLIPSQNVKQEHDDEPQDISKAFLKGVFHEEEEEIFHAPLKAKEPFIRPSLKDYDISSDKETFDSEGEKKEELQRSWTDHLNVSPFRSIRLFSFFLMGFLLVAGVVGVEFYLRASEKSEEDEFKAAASISDISMALTYAQLYHISPLKHNWSDPEFIQNNLLATLPTGSPSDVRLNCQGEFGNCAYILRVYTSNDLSHFLVVAHPTPSLFQWLIPRSALIVDSSTMEIRRIVDLKALNRLLASLNTLDGVNVTQISDLVKKSEIITLAKLAEAVKKPDFATTKLLSLIRPGAENLIYNAPRYHPFGGALLKKAEHFSSMHTSSHELAMFQSELEMLKRLPNLVLYTTDSSETGKYALDGLKMIAPDEKYLLGSIKNDSKGHFKSSNIVLDSANPEKVITLIEEEPKKLSVSRVHEFDIGPSFSDTFFETTRRALGTISKMDSDDSIDYIAEKDEEKLEAKEESIADVQVGDEEQKVELHDLYLQLAELAEKRVSIDRKIKEKINKAVSLYFKKQNSKKLIARLDALKNYQTDAEIQIKEELFDAIYLYGELPPQQISEWTRKLNLYDLYEEVLLGQ